MKHIKRNNNKKRNKIWKHQLNLLISFDHGSNKERNSKHNKLRKNGQNNSIHKT